MLSRTSHGEKAMRDTFLGTTSAHCQAQYDDSKKPAKDAGISVCSDINSNLSIFNQSVSNQQHTDSTTQSYFFTIPGEPVAMARHRTTRSGHTYTPKKTADAKCNIAYAVSQQYKGLPLDSPLRLTAIFYFTPPQNLIKKYPAELKAEAIPVIKRPDADNLVKLICDALNGILWTDDKLIVDVRAIKRYSQQPRVSFTVEVLA